MTMQSTVSTCVWAHLYTFYILALCLVLYYIGVMCNWNLLLLASSCIATTGIISLMSYVDADHAVDHAVDELGHYLLHVCTRDTHSYAVVQH
jgi:hypothetical protein